MKPQLECSCVIMKSADYVLLFFFFRSISLPFSSARLLLFEMPENVTGVTFNRLRSALHMKRLFGGNPETVTLFLWYANKRFPAL